MVIVFLDELSRITYCYTLMITQPHPYRGTCYFCLSYFLIGTYRVSSAESNIVDLWIESGKNKRVVWMICPQGSVAKLVTTFTKI